MGRCTGCAENPKCNKPNKGRSPKCLECQGNWLRSYKRDAATERRAKVKRKREVQREVGNENAVTRNADASDLAATTLGGPMPIPSDGAVTVAVPAGAVPGTVLQIADPGPAAARGKRRRRRGRGGGITVPAASETLRKPTDSNMAQEAATKEAALPEGVGGQAGERVVGNLTGPRRRPSKRQRRDETQARVFKEPVISAVELTAEMVLKMRASKTDFGAPHSTGRPHQDYLVCTKPRGS
jgi:hypothetical protein